MVEHPAVNGRVAGSSPALGGQPFFNFKFMFWVYILRSIKNGTIYIGSTEDLPRRLAEHKQKKKYYELIYKESRPTKDEAFQREMYFKTGKGRRSLKNILVAGSPATHQAGARP